jgi:hypothetical protein
MSTHLNLTVDPRPSQKTKNSTFVRKFAILAVEGVKWVDIKNPKYNLWVSALEVGFYTGFRFGFFHWQPKNAPKSGF